MTKVGKSRMEQEINLFIQLGLRRISLSYIHDSVIEGMLKEKEIFYYVFHRYYKCYLELKHWAIFDELGYLYEDKALENLCYISDMITLLPLLHNVNSDLFPFENLEKKMHEICMLHEKICLDMMDIIFQDRKNIKHLKLPLMFKKLSNHNICHEMFRDALNGRTKMFIQMPDLERHEAAYKYNYRRENNEEGIILQCSLLTLQMIHYDSMMFSAMNSDNDPAYKEDAKERYHPYFFNFIAEIKQGQYEELKNAQKNLKRNNLGGEDDSYLWMECTFIPVQESISINGYVIQSASPVEKIEKPLYILSGTEISYDDIKLIVDTYEITKDCERDDKFNQLIKDKIGNRMLSSVNAYRIGNGNCIFMNIGDDGEGFFYDIGFNCKHRPRNLERGPYNYSDSMRKIIKNKPSFFILSHWDLDHILGISAAGKDYFDVDWFAPDCQDACIDAKRLAKYLDYKNHLFRVERKNTSKSGRLIGEPIEIMNGENEQVAKFKLYMGEKSGCDSSYPNCEGIVIEYVDFKGGKERVVLMMGDVNYASFDKARENTGEPKIANSQIDYLIVPHHGSQHTDFTSLIKDEVIHKGKLAVICCTNNVIINRPNKEHVEELKKRFEVVTTEEAKKDECCISIPL